MRLISFSLTEPQFINKTKDVTRRLGWLVLKPGDRLVGCRKVMGRRKGEPLVRLGEIEVVSVRREPLRRMIKELKYGEDECRREGFPEMSPFQFVGFFCESHGIQTDEFGHTDQVITRIEFKYL